MQVLVVVINHDRYVVPILDQLMEIGIAGATILDSMGMAAMIADHVPFFARFANMNGRRHNSKTLFTVIRDDQVEKVADAVDAILGGVDRPDSGFMFALPVSMCRGLACSDQGPRGR